MIIMKQTNRSGGEFIFEKVSDNFYELIALNEKMNWCVGYSRCGGQEGAETIDFSDLGFIDPAGGPFIFPGYSIGDKKVKKISIEKHGDNERILFEVE